AAGWSSCSASWTTRPPSPVAAATTARASATRPRRPPRRWRRLARPSAGPVSRWSDRACGPPGCRPSAWNRRGASPPGNWPLNGVRWGAGRGGVEVDPRRMWPTGQPAVGMELEGGTPAGELAAQGRALGRLSDIGWGDRLRPMFASGAPDGPVPDDVAKAVVGVLADWARGPGGWASGGTDAVARPVGVVTMASRTRPVLIQSLR